MIKKTIKTLAMAFLVGTAAAVRAGDIVSIDVLEDAPYSLYNGGKTYPNDDNPHSIGESIFIRIRLINYDVGRGNLTTTHDARSTPYPWEYVSMSSYGSDPKLGLLVGGVTRYATLVSCLPTAETIRRSQLYYTDLIFEYTVLPGDLAQPIRLRSRSGGEVATATDTLDIVLPGFYASFKNAVDTTDPADEQKEAEFSFCGEELRDYGFFSSSERYPPANTSADEAGSPRRNPTLEGQEVYVKTIDFDSDYVDTTTDPKVWRTIAQGSTKPTKLGNPSIVVDASATFEGTGYATMWVWTEDDNILTPVGETQTYNVGGVDRKALPIKISTGDEQKLFVLKATGAEGDGAWVYMSSAPTNMYGNAGQLIKNTVRRWITVGAPEKPSIAVTFKGNSWAQATATGAYMEGDYPVEMAITLSEPASEAITVTLDPVLLNDGANIDVYANHVIATAPSAGLGNGWQLATNVVTFAAGDIEKFLYVYPLGATKGSARNGGTGIEFQISMAPATADAHFVTKTPGVFYVNPAAPNVLAPVSGQAYEFTAGVPKDITITIDDSCRNMRYLDGADEVVVEGTNLYTVVWERNDDTSTSRLEWKGLKPVLTSGEGTLTLTGVKYPNSGTYLTSQITVIGPEGTKTVIPVSVEVSLPRTVTGTPDHENLTYSEGETVKLTLNLSKRDGESLYAFVEPLNADATNFLAGAQMIGANGQATGKGVEIPGTGTTTPKTINLTVIDGPCEPKFQVVLCSEEIYDKDKIVDRYAPQPVTLFCENVPPKGEKLVVGGGSIDESGGQLEYSVPADNAVSLAIQIGDVAADRQLLTQPNETLIDWIGPPETDPDVFTNGLFITKWNFFNAKGKKVETRITVGSRNRQAVTNFTFTSIGTNRVEVQMLDKDMIKALLDNGVARDEIVKWSNGSTVVPYGDETGFWSTGIVDDDWGPKFVAYIPVEDKANVFIEPVNISSSSDGESGFFEGATSGGFDIYLSVPAPVPLKVKLWVERMARTEGVAQNIGTLGSFEIKNTELGMDTNEYVEVSFKRGVDMQHVSITGMDGTPYSNYRLHAIVTTTTPNDDDIPMNEFYNDSYYDFWVFNKDPVLKSIKANVGISFNQSTGEPSTNVVTLTQNQDVTIDWNVADFIRMDETNDFTVTWSSSEPGTIAESNNVVRGTYKTKFKSAGEKTITLSINDKDGGANFYEWHFKVEASKRLYTLPLLPYDPLSDIVAAAYGMADGLGSGTVTADGSTGGSSLNGDIWDYAVEKNTAVISAVGDAGSYVYAFISELPSDNSVFTPELMKNDPQIGTNAVNQLISLPLAEKDAIAYPDRYVEVVFSREFLEADNLGDINQDGIPDIFAKKLLVARGGAPTIGLGDDMEVLTTYNHADEYLPGVWQINGEMTLKANAGSSYAPIGHAFTAIRKIRGFHEGLNYIDEKRGALTVISDPDFGEDEQKAWEKFVADNNEGKTDTDPDWLDVTKPDLLVWSPEPRGDYIRMNPTVADTDGDDFPDSWEYFFWYQARVWKPAAENGVEAKLGQKRDGQLFVFERFNANDILRGTAITDAEVLERFNPCTQLDTSADDFNPDFDRDGLSDYEELLIGTNPCHWDTDADHMCDGWEVMHSLDPLNGSKSGNPDGDFMAYTSLRGYFAVKVSNNNGPATYVFDLGSELREFRDYETKDIEMYAMKSYYDTLGFYIQTADAQEANGDANYPLYYYTDADGNMRYTIEQVDPDGNPTVRYTMMGAITIRDVPLESALIAPEKQDARGAPYLYGLDTDAPPVPIPAVWHWSYPMLDHRLLSQDDGMPLFRRSGYTIPNGTLLIHTRHILIHDQVHAAFGFDPRTGWYANGAGYVADRWNPQINGELSPLDSTGVAVNTDPYTDYDEYLVMKYRHDFGIRYYDDAKYDADNIWATFLAYSTKPNVVYAKTDIEAVLNPTNDTENATTYDAETVANLTATANIAEYLANAFAEAGSNKSTVKGHGADTDGDGVPDGWELYKSRNPNSAPSRPTAVGNEGFNAPWDKEELDGTPDYLGYTAEYAGTDSCNAYKDCPSIYNNHPGLHSAGDGFQQGWFNKFFPTDPDNPDTDGDGILDGAEGMAWLGTWYNGGVAYMVAGSAPGMTFIYGNPEDSITCCVRGGGMNPCTVDTDIDGLPDPWEMQYAGIPVDALSRRYVGPAPNFDPDIDDATFTADGLNEAGFTIGEGIVYICSGMDATWGGDGWTDPLDNGNSTDARLGTLRDVDFDHDGLQNYQEYLVQQVRHFRYDDITTPLMGHYLDEGEYDLNNLMGPLLSDHVLSVAPAFTPMMQDADDFVVTAIGNWGDGAAVSIVTNTIDSTITINEFTGDEITNFVYEVITNIMPGNTVIAQKYYGTGYNYMYSTPWSAAGWRANGYMASPIHDWDRMITCMVIQPSIMMPAAGVYVSTDPRLADTDSDGMDDYYEMFHGLNPILGSTAAGAKDIIALAWGAPEHFNAFWNEWTHKDFNRYLALLDVPGSFEDPMPLQTPAALDPILYPWAMGAGEADPDGDGLRNDSERVTANLTSPMTSHTDPTPLWFTDASSVNSYVGQYYRNTAPVSAMPFWPIMIGFDDPYSAQTPDGGYGGLDFLYPFEENEGYDTDNDWRSDGHEIVTTTRPASDPLDFSDPSRRQALYLNGDNSWVQSRSTFLRDLFMGRTPSSTTVDLFKQFTVEAWICPEKTGEQTILDRCSAYGYDAINKDASAIRSNFRIGLTADGRVYGMFDNDDAVESGRRESVSCQSVFGPQVPLNKWTHVAMSYDGNALVLYINGIERGRAATHLIPANGVTAVMQDPTYTNSFVSISYEAVPGAFFIGGRPVSAAAGGASAFGVDTVDYAFMNQDEWYQGYVDEVRIWDGARTASEISENYAKKLSKAEISENRENVYAHLMSANADSSRNDNDGLLNLTAELVQLYDFSTLPGAVDAGDVAKAPSGFATAVVGQLVSTAQTPGFSTEVGWWTACLTKSTVYDNYSVVPWVENAVHHLPVIDGSVVDSFLYSDYLGGYVTLATKHTGLEKYALNNSSMPYAFHNYYLERYQRLFKLNLLMAANPDDALVEDLVYRYEYEIRSDFIGTSDLIPMGGAYAKTAPTFWDGNGVADAWEYTQTDTDADGLPDWWEGLYGLDPNGNYDWNTTIDWNGASIPAYVAYAIDLSLGMQPDGQYHPEYASTVDADGDNIPDWWEKLFGVEKYSAEDDADRDGLSNYAEYTVSFGPYPYGITNGWTFVSPINAFSTSADQKVPDYYLRAPQAFDASGRHISENEYFGEIFTDHDFMESWWEKGYSLNFANPRVYDPDKDADSDGWSNWAEARTYMWRGAYSADLIDNYYDVGYNHINDYPRPALGLRFVYNGINTITSAGLVVRATTGRSPRVDATFNLNYDATKVSTVTSIIGGYYDNATTIHGFLNPGSLVAGETRFTTCHLSGERTYEWTVGSGTTGITASGSFSDYVRAIRLYGVDNVTLVDTALPFDPFAMTTSDSTGRKGEIIVLAEASASGVGTSIGTINFLTGEYEINLAKAVSVGVNLDGMVLRAEYTYAIPNEWPKTFWLSEPTSGWVREGLNTIEAWIDLDGNGSYTAGEPYGIVRNVNVGWHKTTETVIELKDTSSIIPHYLLSDGSSDRTVVLGLSGGVAAATSGGDDSGNGSGAGAGAGNGLTTKIAVRRVGINGMLSIGAKTVPARTLVSKTFVLDDRAYLTEADVLSDDKFDLDCKWLVSDATKLGLTVSDLKSAEYEIDQIIEFADGTTTNIALATFSNTFSKQRPIPVARAPLADAPVYAAAPTFYWACADDTMTAFRLQVSTSTNASDVIYDSGIRQLPGRDSLTVGGMAYAFTPPLYVGDPVATNGAPVFADATNYYWRVAEVNAKYSDVDSKSWSVWAPFQMDVANENRYPKQPTGYGQCSAVVRYFGPGEAPEGQVVVEVHSSADFANQPLAQVRADITQLDDMYDVETVNATFKGIAPGTVYLMAYIDSNNNGKRDVNESWGYANYVGTDNVAIFTPRGVTVTDEAGRCPTLVVYIEDTDVNRNEIPDINEAATAAGEDAAAGDSDRDGLLDNEEDSFATDASVWDTDGDGMPDGWEVKFADLDPNFNDAVEAAEGDVMAFVKQDCTIVTVRNTDGSDAVNYILKDGQLPPVRGDSIDGYSLYVPYDYPVVTSNGVESCYGRGAEVQLTAAAGTTNRVIDVSSSKVVLVHWQVYDEFGFNPRTANPVAFANGTAVNTKEFTALDKYLVIRYLEALGLCGEDEVNVKGQWAQYSLRPFDSDNDLDGIADGWELYVMFGHGDAQELTMEPSPNVISPWVFDDRSMDHDGDKLADVHEYDRGNYPTDPWDVDSDGDGVTDDFAWKYHLKGTDGVKDFDGDGLSNYVEYMLAEVFSIAEFSPDDAFSVNPRNVPDYFYRLNELYVGEIFTDHDRVWDVWESGYFAKENEVSPYVYDEMLDPDGDGWSNYSEFQAGTAPTKLGSLSVDAIQMDEYPVPTIEIKLSYNGNQSVGDKAVVAKAWSDPELATIPDAVWTLGGQGNVSVTENGNSNIVTGVKYFGMNPRREMLIHLSPGSVVPGSVKFEFKDLAWVLYNELTEQGYLNDPVTALWEGGIIDQQRNDSSGLGDIVSQDETTKSLGTIDYATGEMKVDFAAFSEFFAIVGDISGRVNGEGWLSVYNLQKSYVRVNWQSKLIAGSTVTTYYLSEADKRSASNNSLGHVKEGLNTFVAFYDLDGDGMYTAGEPYGCATGVDVGWNYARAEIELTDTHPVSARVCCITGAAGGGDAAAGATGGGSSGSTLGQSDRQVLWGTEHGDIPAERILVSQETGGKEMRLRVVRTLIDGEDCRNFGVPAREILNKVVCVDSVRYLTEADFLANGALDIDWETLYTDLAASVGSPVVSNVTYRIVMGEGSVENSETNNCVGAFNRWFDSQAVYNAAKPILLDDDQVVTAVSPTFKWAIPSGLGTYTAFRIEITGDGFAWDSGFQRMPSRIMDPGEDYKCHYEWTAPICVDDLVAINGRTARFANDKRYAWRVTLANARFRENWSVQGHFYMNVPEPSRECGKAQVAVRYYGPSNVANGSVIRVEAFTTPDFSGEPVSRGYVTNKSDIASADAITVANATLPGLKVGSYYIRAYIDTQSNGTHQDWESWGCYCTRDVTTGTIYTPKSVTVGPEIGGGDIIPVYIDDCDTDRDCLPDAWEWAENGNLSTYGSAQIDQTATGGFALKTSLGQNLKSGGSPSGGLAVMVSRVLSSPRIAAQIVGVDATGTDDQVNSALASASGDAEATPVAVAITAITLDRTAGTVAISADTEGAAVGSLASDIYTIPAGSDTLELTCKVMHRDSLDSGDWTVIKTEKVTIEKKSRTYTFNLGSSSIDLSSGFFKVSLEK